MIELLAFALLASGDSPSSTLSEAAHALEADRIVQARRMIADAIAAGERGPEIDRFLADLAFAEKRWAEAQARYADLLRAEPSDSRSAERAGIASLAAGDVGDARRFIEKAIALGSPSWRVWNALGVLCDFEANWDCADAAYGSAVVLVPNQPEILNNHGWSLILRGEWASAVQSLERAAQADPKSTRIKNNLELVRAAVSADLPRRHRGESSADFAARLNDAGVAAAQRGERKRAIAALSQALVVSDSWYARAANNLAGLQRQ